MASKIFVRQIKLKDGTTMFSLFLSKNPLPNGIGIVEFGEDRIRIAHNSGRELDKFISLLKRKKVEFKEL